MAERQPVAVLSIALTLVAACASQPITVDFNPDAGFSSFRTFAMVSRPDSASPQLIDDGMRTAIETQLEAKGLRDTTRARADLLVGYGIVWQARAPDVLLLPPGSVVHARQQIDGAVAELFTKFPPSSKG